MWCYSLYWPKGSDLVNMLVNSCETCYITHIQLLKCHIINKMVVFVWIGNYYWILCLTALRIKIHYSQNYFWKKILPLFYFRWQIQARLLFCSWCMSPKQRSREVSSEETQGLLFLAPHLLNLWRGACWNLTCWNLISVSLLTGEGRRENGSKCITTMSAFDIPNSLIY